MSLFHMKNKENSQISDAIPVLQERKTTSILAYRTYDDLRTVCRKEIETLEHWARRLIHEILSEKYGQDYFTYVDKNNQPLIKHEIKNRVSTMRENNPGRFPRPIDAFFLGDILYILCREDLFSSCFRSALITAYPQGNEEARVFLQRIESIRNKLSHSNPISVHEAEQIICYCHDFIESLKVYYKETGKEKDYNVPSIIGVSDNLGSYFNNRGSSAFEWSIVQSAEKWYETEPLKLRAGDLYSLTLTIDPAFDESQYLLSWTMENRYSSSDYKQSWGNTRKIDIPITKKWLERFLK